MQLARRLRIEGFSAITLNGRADDGHAVEVLFLVEKPRRLGQLLKRIKSADPKAICTISDVKRHVIPNGLVAPPLRRAATRK